MSRPIGQACVAVIAASLALFPFHGVFLGSTPLAIYNALAADVYYYAAMARNFTLYGFFGVDGQTVSTGYMPLWQIIVAGLDLVFAGPGTEPQWLLALIFGVSAVLIAVGIAALAVFIAQRYGTGPAILTLPLLCPGAAFLLLDHSYKTAPVGLHSGHGLWSYANGMESGIGLFLFAIFVPLAARCLDADSATRRLAVWVGALAFLIFMARLDDVFAGLAFGLCLLPVAVRLADTRLLVAAAIVPLIGTAAYLGINTALSGATLPSSGMLKTELFGFPNRWADVAAIGRNDLINARILPLLAALTIGGLGLLSQSWRNWRSSDTPLIVMLSLYLVLKSGFLLSSVALHEQGYWYYTNMLAAINLLVVISVLRVVHLSTRAALIGGPVALVIAGIAGLNAQAQLNRYPANSYATVARDVCSDPAPYQALLPANAPIIDTADGFYAFCLGRPAVTLTGLADSRTFNLQRNALGFYGAALEWGHTVMVTSPVPYASYDWRGQLGEKFEAAPLGRQGQVRVWRIQTRD